jgi:hypothetical protein
MKYPSGTIPIEFKSGDSEAAPETAVLYESALGGTEAASGDIATSTDHTSSVIYMADTSAFDVNDIVLVKSAGGDILHVSPIDSISANTSITLLVAHTEAFADSVTVKKAIDYRTADSGHPSFSITKYNTGSDPESAATVETAAGCKVSSMAIENWTTGQHPTVTLAYEGMVFTHDTGTSSYTPSFDASLPVVALAACVYKDGSALVLNDFTLSLENTLAPKTSTCNANGRTGIRVGGREITGTINPYKQDDSVSEWDAWDADTTFSLFAYAYNGTTSAKTEVVAIYIPKCQYQEVAQSNIEGLAQNAFTFTAREPDNDPAMMVAFG